MKSPTCKELILLSLSFGKPLACYEIQDWMEQRGHYHSESAISARTRELAREGKLTGQRREKMPLKEWSIPKGQGTLFDGN